MRGLAITPDGQKFIAPGDRWTLNLWHTESDEKLHALRGHTNKISRVEMTPDGQHAVSASWDGTLRIWDLAVGRTTVILTGHNEPINDLAITPDGQHVLSVSNYGLKFWDLATEKEIFSQQLPLMLQAVTVSPDGNYIIIGLSNGYSGVILLWNYVTGEQQMLTGHAGLINQLLVTPDNRYIISVSFDATIRVWEINTGQEIFVFRGDQYGAGSIALTADGNYLFSESIDNTIKIWDFRQALKKRSHPLPSIEVKNIITVPNRSIYDFRSISGQKELLLNLNDKEIARLNRSTGEVTETLAVGSNALGKMLITSDEKYLIVAGREISTWNLSRRAKSSVYEKAHSDTVAAVSITSNGKYGITASLDRTIKIWDIKNRTVLSKLDGYGNHVPPLIAITPDGNYIVAGSDNFYLNVWQIATGQKIHTLQGHTRNITRVKISADGRLAISASDDGSVRLWDLNSGQEQCSLPPKAMLDVQTQSHSVSDFVLSPDNQYLVTISYELQPTIWHVPSAKIAHQLQRGKSLDNLTEITGKLTITPNGTAVILYSNRHHSLELFEIATGNYLYELETQLYEEPEQWIWFSKGNYLLGRFKTQIRVWNMESRQTVLQENLSKEISDCVLTADEQRLIVTTMDGTVEILDLASGKILVRFMGEAPLNSCGVTPDGRTIMAGGWHGDIHFLYLQEPPFEDEVLANLKSFHKLPGSPSETPIELSIGGSGQDFSRERKGLSFVRKRQLSPFSPHRRRQNPLRRFPPPPPCLLTLDGHLARVIGIAFSPNGKFLASSSEDGFVRFWNVTTGECDYHLPKQIVALHDVAWSPCGKLLAMTSWHERTVLLWHIVENQFVWQTNVNEVVNLVTFSPDGKIIAVCGGGTIWLWRVTDRYLLATLKGHVSLVDHIRFSPDGVLLISAAGGQDGTVRFWEVATGNSLGGFRVRDPKQYTGGSMALDISPDGSLIATSNIVGAEFGIWQINQEGQVELLQVYRTDEEIRDIIWHIAFRHDGLIAAGGRDGKIYLWHIFEGQLLHIIPAHPGRIFYQSEELQVDNTRGINDIVWSPDGQILATAGDRRVTLWQV